MNRNHQLKESLTTAGPGRNSPRFPQHLRRPLTGLSSKDNYADDNTMDLFSRNRRSLSLASPPPPSSDDSSSDLSVKLGRLSVGSAKPARNGLDDLLASTEGGKHDYDWLLTPPGTPVFPFSDGKESPPMSAAPRSSSLARSSSAAKTSRLSVSQPESNHSSRPARSSSVTRSSISTTQYSSYSNKTNILNTSSASVSSYIRPSTPTNRSSSTSRPSTPSTRTTPSRSSTPSRTRPSPTSTSLDKTKPSQSSRPSTPSSRTQIPASLSSPPIRSISRPSTPTCRNSAPSLTPSTGPSASIGRAPSNGRNAAPSLSRPSSPSPRVRTPPQPIVLPDFPLDTPPNLRTTLPDRPLSAGRSRPGAAVTVKGNVETTSPANVVRRQSSPIVNRGRLVDPPGRGRPHSNGHVVDTLESRKISIVSELSLRKAAKPSAPDSSTGFGRSISKNSLNMAIRHMDIRNGSSRPLSGSTLFPQSIRSGNPKGQPGRASSVDGHYPVSSNNGVVLPENGNYMNGSPRNGAVEDRHLKSSKLTDVDIYESSRYDAILLKEDLKNTSWLHGGDDNSDQGPLFDNGFESLPEPFGPL